MLMPSLRTQRTQLAGVAAFALLIIGYASLKFGTSSRLDWNRHHRAGGYPYVKPDPLLFYPPRPKFANSSSAPTPHVPNRVIVLTTLEGEDTTWANSTFPNWEVSLQTIGLNFAKLHVGAKKTDKGRIANSYLTYLIENYYILPDTVVFLNTMAPKKYEIPTLSDAHFVEILVDSVLKTGFVNLRCISKTHCTSHFRPTRDPPDEYRTLEAALSKPKIWREIFGNDNVPERLASPCCAEIAVSREQVRKRPVEDYINYWNWLNKTTMDDDTTGLVFEYIWHIIFGQEAEYCTKLKSCECGLYGEC